MEVMEYIAMFLAFDGYLSCQFTQRVYLGQTTSLVIIIYHIIHSINIIVMTTFQAS